MMGELRRRLPLVAAGCALVMAACLAEPPEGAPPDPGRAPLGAGTFEEVSEFGTNPGGLKMFRYVPPTASADAALVVALHPCSMDATGYRRAGWEELADEHGFYVLYPEQQLANNPIRCFNWAGEGTDPPFGTRDEANLLRGQGENQSITEMVQRMLGDFPIDGGSVFVSGQSSGGAQAAIMLATWPDLFAAGASIGGIPFRCATTAAGSVSCMNPGVDRSPTEWGDLVRAAYSEHVGPHPRFSIWYGTADMLVAPRNAVELVEQWTDVHGVDAEPDLEDVVDGFPHFEHRDMAGRAVVELYEVSGAPSTTFVDPEVGCGEVAGGFMDFDICSACRIAEFFGIAGCDGGGDGCHI